MMLLERQEQVRPAVKDIGPQLISVDEVCEDTLHLRHCRRSCRLTLQPLHEPKIWQNVIVEQYIMFWKSTAYVTYHISAPKGNLRQTCCKQSRPTARYVRIKAYKHETHLLFKVLDYQIILQHAGPLLGRKFGLQSTLPKNGHDIFRCNSMTAPRSSLCMLLLGPGRHACMRSRSGWCWSIRSCGGSLWQQSRQSSRVAHRTSLGVGSTPERGLHGR